MKVIDIGTTCAFITQTDATNIANKTIELSNTKAKYKLTLHLSSSLLVWRGAPCLHRLGWESSESKKETPWFQKPPGFGWFRMLSGSKRCPKKGPCHGSSSTAPWTLQGGNASRWQGTSDFSKLGKEWEDSAILRNGPEGSATIPSLLS